MKKSIKAVLIHGNGGATVQDLWFPHVKDFLENNGVSVIAQTFPDNDLARESIWMPFLENELKPDENTILIGHSSGAVLAMRYAEKHKILGSVLVGACHTDLGDEIERQAGYYDSPWNWEAIQNNQKWITQFASTDDPYIPIVEPRFIHEQLNSEYYEFTNYGHFMVSSVPEIFEALKSKLSSESTPSRWL